MRRLVKLSSESRHKCRFCRRRRFEHFMMKFLTWDGKRISYWSCRNTANCRFHMNGGKKNENN